MTQDVSTNFKNFIKAEVHDSGSIDYVNADGELVRYAPLTAVMVRNADDLDDLDGIYEAGTIAFTAGFVNMWQLDAEGTWNAVNGDSE